MINRLSMSLALGVAGCAAGAAPGGAGARFACDGGARFEVAYAEDGARLVTARGAHRLEARPSSIGRKFAAGDIALIVDEDRAALNGLPGETFRQCRQIENRRIVMGQGE